MINYKQIANALGRAYPFAHEKTVAGKNRSLSNIDFNPTLDPYRKEWTKNWFADFSKEHRGRAMASFNILAQILRNTASRFNCVFEIETDTPSRLKSILRPLGDDSLDAIAETPALNGPYNSTWIPEYAIILEASPSGKANTSILFEGKRYTVNLQACDFGPFLERLCTLPLGCEKAILRRHYMDLIPKSLKDKYKTVTIIEDVGYRDDTGMEYYGHQAELIVDKNHVFKYLYSAFDYSTVLDDHFIEEAYRWLKDISAVIPELSVTVSSSQLYNFPRNDRHLSDKGYVMDKIRNWNILITEDTIKNCLDSFRVGEKTNIDTATLSRELYFDYTKGFTTRRIKEIELYNNLDIAKRKWILSKDWDFMHLFFISGNDDDYIKIVIDIPYNCPKSAYMKILDAHPLLKQCAQALSSHNANLSVCVVPV